MKLPKELTSLVKQSVALLGQVIQRELGKSNFQIIENLRLSMAQNRKLSSSASFLLLQKHYEKLKLLKSQDLHHIAHSFTLMLELMNACENAYRSHRLNFKKPKLAICSELPKAIIYVLTAHPTEARSPQNIAIFHEIQNILIQILDRSGSLAEKMQEIQISSREKENLLHALEVAWRTPIVRNRKPQVKDEAEHIYSLLFRDDTLFSLLEKSDTGVSFYVRTWVGGDKDGHPGVNEKTLLQSYSLSRKKLLQLILKELLSIRATLKIFPSKRLQLQISQIEKILHRLHQIRIGDARTVGSLRNSLAAFKLNYEKELGAVHPLLLRLQHLIHAFPALVVPIELRESSDMLMGAHKDRQKLAIYKMLNTVEKISRGGDPRWYARGFIISMTESIEHILAAGQFQKAVFGDIPLPIIPLFETSHSLAHSESIMSEFIKTPRLKKAVLNNWNGRIEMMVGYSDSAKEAGALASRLAIAETLPQLEKVCLKSRLTPVFFHGSGGSVDRGGGSIEDQTAWWPKSALRLYKVTVQGEMIERSLATTAIAKRQTQTIIESAVKGLCKPFKFSKDLAVESFARKISDQYRQKLTAPEFLKLVEHATPYSYLSILKIGSRPSKRSVQVTIKGLRAIPWVLCWTQTRVLFPTWWGVGTAWKNSSKAQQSALKRSFQKDPVFTSYIKALGFTLAKIEMGIWRVYLEQSSLSKTEIANAIKQFEDELTLTHKCYYQICGKKDLLWFKPWLGESIMLRSAMIHPLNLLQLLAMKNGDHQLLRVSVTGISSGMLTTG